MTATHSWPMPPWDPVRDAVRAQAVSPQKPFVNLQNGNQASTPPKPLVVIPASPSKSTTTPRATSLAMLLNDGTTYRSSLSPVFPTSTPTVSATASTSARLALTHSSTGLPIDMLVNPVDSRNTSHHKATPPMKPSPIPYNPDRVSRPASVLVPLTDADRRTFSRPVNSLRRAMAHTPLPTDDSPFSLSQPQTSGGYSPSQVQTVESTLPRKRRRSIDDGPDGESPFKRVRDRDHIAFHYNARPEVGVNARRDSPIFGLKAFNNWIKSVLIQKMTAIPLSRSPSKRPLARGGQLSGRVLDIGCGKGGDLQKWQKANIKEYVALDIAIMSVNAAQKRWNELKGVRFDATFARLDCYVHPISDEIPQNQLADLFDVVTMQFCMHYAFESESKVRTMLDNVTKYLRPGGRFIGTTPNAEILLSSLEEARREDPETLTFGNSVYNVQFDTYKGPIYGHRYMFFLADAVEHVPEYVVDWDNFVRVANEYGLSLLYKKEFHEIYQEESEDLEFGSLLKKMKVADEHGESAMDEDQWDAANVYLAFAFEKTQEQPP